MTAVSVAELQRAWHAVEEGRFKPERAAYGQHGIASDGTCSEPDAGWTPPGPVLPVLGCHSGAGTTTVAVAVATALGRPVHLIEASPLGASGLTGFATAELGPTGRGWLRGHRGALVLDRLERGSASPGRVPLPVCRPQASTLPLLLDTGWPVSTLLGSPGWIRSAVSDAEELVVVTTATIPGLRRLENALHILDAFSVSLVVAIRGPRRRRWPKEVGACIGPRARLLLDTALVEVPHEPSLAIRGLDTSPLPGALVAAATRITELLSAIPTHAKEIPEHVH